MEEKNTIQFDPGYAPIVMESIGQVGYTYYMFNAVKNVKIKRQNFLLISIKLEKLLKENVNFYFGCLLWACYISNLNNYNIEGNKLLGEECTKEEYTSEINFLIDFIENQYPRDYKYYKSKSYVPDEKYLPILKTYKEFLILNDGFINCSNTNQIVLPKNLKQIEQSKLNEVFKAIQEAIEKRNLGKLLDFYGLIF